MSVRNRRRVYQIATNAALGRGRRTAMAALGAVLLVFNLLGGIALGMASPSPADLLGDPAQGRIVLCTASGMVAIDREGRKIPVAAHRGDAKCPYCMPLIGGAAAPAAVFEFVVARSGFRRAPAPRPVAMAPPRRLILAALARGPPA